MPGSEYDGSAALSPSESLYAAGDEVLDNGFDWVDFRLPCPRCGVEIRDFKTKDLCRQHDMVDYRLIQHFYAECDCGAWIDFIRKPAIGLDDFEMYVEQL
jgi:hypothetical protein